MSVGEAQEQSTGMNWTERTCPDGAVLPSRELSHGAVRVATDTPGA